MKKEVYFLRTVVGCKGEQRIGFYSEVSGPKKHQKPLIELSDRLQERAEEAGYDTCADNALGFVHEGKTYYAKKEPTIGDIAHEEFHARVEVILGYEYNYCLLPLEEAYAHLIDTLTEKGPKKAENFSKKSYRLLQQYRRLLKAKRNGGITPQMMGGVVTTVRNFHYKGNKNLASFLDYVEQFALYPLAHDVYLQFGKEHAEAKFIKAIQLSMAHNGFCTEDINRGIRYLLTDLDKRRAAKYQELFVPPTVASLGTFDDGIIQKIDKKKKVELLVFNHQSGLQGIKEILRKEQRRLREQGINLLAS